METKPWAAGSFEKSDSYKGNRIIKDHSRHLPILGAKMTTIAPKFWQLFAIQSASIPAVRGISFEKRHGSLSGLRQACAWPSNKILVSPTDNLAGLSGLRSRFGLGEHYLQREQSVSEGKHFLRVCGSLAEPSANGSFCCIDFVGNWRVFDQSVENCLLPGIFQARA